MRSVQPVTGALSPTRDAARHRPRWAVVEILLATAVVVRDVFLPTLVLLALAAGSVVARRQPWREGLRSLGFHRVPAPWRMTGQVLAITIGWTALQLGLFMPVLEHLTGSRQDVSQFARLEGNLPLLLTMLALSWTLAALGEEVAFRGYLFTRLREALPDARAATIGALVASALLFGLIHTEQGTIGVALTFLDALLLGTLRLSFRTLWAPVLAHGFNNTIGMVAYFVVGPISGLW
jgi:membrane protease YdiL (CAAX protease family)